MKSLSILTTLAVSPILVSAQFGNFFEQMFSGGGGGDHGHRDSNVGSDSQWYRENWERASCNKFLCSGTLSCVDKPTHCPCAFPDVEDKFEIDSDGLAICLSKSGKVAGLTARKVELARKGLL